MRIKHSWIWILLLCTGANAHFSEEAWQAITPTYRRIVQHPFNQELVRGTLSKERYQTYLDQDALYLQVFAGALRILAQRLDSPEESANLEEFARQCEREHEASKGGVPNAATRAYVAFLKAVSARGTAAELAAALLPCFWIYSELAADLKPSLDKEHPYKKWFETYQAASYRKSVQWMVALCDRLAGTGDQKQMVRVFKRAADLEWFFWDVAYREGKKKPNREARSGF